MAARGEFAGTKDGLSCANCEGAGGGRIYFDKALRFITISGAISEELADIFFNTLTDFEAKNPKKAVALFLNSEGGELYSTWKMYDHALHYRVPLITIAAGLCYSGGLMLFMAGDKRLILPHATLRFHAPWRQTDGKEYPADSAEASRHHQVLYRQMRAMFRERGVKMTMGKLKHYFNIQKRLTAEEAVKLGLAHQILVPRGKFPLALNAYQKNLLDLNEPH